MFRIRNPAPSKPNSDDGGDSRGCHPTAAKWILPRKKGSCALLWSWPFMIFRCQGGRGKGQGWSVCENKIGEQTSVRVRTGRFWDSTERALGGGMQGMECGRGQNILCWLGGITLRMREGAKLVLQPTPSGWMKYVQPMQCIAPFSSTRARFEA